jgi:hypothetical protein
VKKIVQMVMGAVVLICGCATAPKAPVVAPSSPAGKYYSTHNLASFTLLKPDGRFVVRENGGTLKGKYTVKGHTLLLTPDFQQVSLLGNINGRALIDNNGECWMRPPHSFTNRTVRDESFLVLQKRLPEGWLLRFWEGRYGLCKRPAGPPPPSLNADAMVIILRQGETDALARADNMIADTPDCTVHLSRAPFGKLWPNAERDIPDIFLTPPPSSIESVPREQKKKAEPAGSTFP